MKNTKIVATLGPASDTEAIMEQLVEGGVNVFRLNFSHGNHQEHGARIDRIQALRDRLSIPLGIVLDTKGPEIRIGTFGNGPITLDKGEDFTLTTREIEGDEHQVSITYAGLPQDVHEGTSILLDDGLVALRVTSVQGQDIHCTVENGGALSNRKGVNVPGVDVRLPAITDKDVEDILFGIEKGVDFIAASFVRKSADILEIRRLLHEHGGDGIQIISKIECRQAVENIEEIVMVSDAIMVARGDMGVELPLEKVPIVQKELIRLCKGLGRPVIVATQLLDSMIRNPRPTRAEVNDVASAVYDECDCVMLSGESAAGLYPVEAVRTMATICQSIEARREQSYRMSEHPGDAITDAVSFACCQCAMNVKAKAIVTVTSSGHTARMIAKYRPHCAIVATTQNIKTYHRMSLIWGVHALMCEPGNSTDEIMDNALAIASQHEFLKDGDVAVLTAGVPVGVSGSTNLIKVHVLGDVIASGHAMGAGTVCGRVCLARTQEELKRNFVQGDVLVVKQTDHDYLPFMRLSSAIICEDEHVNSHTARIGVALGLPMVLGAANITTKLKNGSLVTVDAERGLVINAQA